MSDCYQLAGSRWREGPWNVPEGMKIASNGFVAVVTMYVYCSGCDGRLVSIFMERA